MWKPTDLETADPAVAALTIANRGPRIWRPGERERILPRLVPVTPTDLTDHSLEGRRRVLDLVARALGSERRRGRSGHWNYSLARHLGLVEAFAAEVEAWRRNGGESPLPRSVRAARATGERTQAAQKAKRRGS